MWAGPFVRLQVLTNFVAVLLRHHYVADNQVGNHPQGFRNARGAIFGFKYFVGGFQTLTYIGSEVGMVFDHQDEGIV